MAPSKLTVFMSYALVSENCLLLETDNVRGQISQHTFASSGGYFLNSSAIFHVFFRKTCGFENSG